MTQPEALRTLPGVIPLGRVAPLRALSEMSPRATAGDISRIQGILNEEIGLLIGTDKKSGENPEVMRYMDLMSGYLSIGNDLSIPALRVGMLTMYHTARLRGEALGVSVPKISPEQLVEYFSERNLDVVDEKLSGFHAISHPWNEVIGDFQKSEPQFEAQLEKIGKSAHPQFVSWELGSALMWDFLKVAPTLQKPLDFS